MSLRALVAPLALCAGCTIVFDADDLRHRDASPMIDAEREPDAEVPDAVPTDADVSLLDVTGSTPDNVDEGVGGEGGRPALILIEGSDIAGDAVVTAAFVEASIAQPVVVETGRAPSGHSIAVSVQIPVLSDLAAGATRTLQLTVTQNGGATFDTVDVVVNGLDELTLTAGTRAVTTLSAKYSHIDVTGAVHFTGAAPLRLEATGDIAISAILDVDGANQTGGVQGCAGGAPITQGDCAGGGGGDTAALGAGSGGGGGGYGTAGTVGGTSGMLVAGAPGATSGNDMLIPFVTAGTASGNRGAGGGGGGNGTLGTGSGGVGGGGGGVASIIAGGDIVVTGAGAIRSKGGNGSVSANSGGGGGAGGAILVRAGGTITNAAWLSAAGGAGGDGTNDGGAGGLGRIRVDAAGGDVTTMATNPAALRGPAWDVASPVIVRTANPGFTFHGPSGRLLGIAVDGESVGDYTVGTGGSKTVDADDFELELGVHELCVAYAAFATSPDTSTPEALSCIDVAYLE